jgi:transcription initiation factor TFIIA large subunit
MAQAQSQFTVSKLYQSVIEDVMTGVRDCFLDQGVDEQVLQELRMLWESKLLATKSVDPITPHESTANGTPLTVTGKVPAQNRQVIHQSTHPVIRSEPSAIVPIQITIPRQANDPPGQKTITLNVPASAIHTNRLQEILTLQTVQATLSLPADEATIQLQEVVNSALKNSGEFERGYSESVIRSAQSHPSVITSQQQHAQANRDNFNIHQSDGQAAGGDSSDDDDEDEDEDDDIDDDIDDKDDEKEEEPEDEGQDEEPLNSGDDVSDAEDSNDKLYEVDNVVVCQYDKITRTRNKWKFHLKDGIMNLNGKDFVFQKSNGDAEW